LAGEYDCVTEPSQVVELRAAVEGLIDIGRGRARRPGQVPGKCWCSSSAGLEQANAALARFRATMTGRDPLRRKAGWNTPS
jgi:hypothetical protein